MSYGGVGRNRTPTSARNRYEADSVEDILSGEGKGLLSVPLGRREEMRVLLADDSEIVRRRLATLIGDIPNVDVIGEAADVTLALTAYQRLRPDTVIIDLHMPGNGFRLIEALGNQTPKATILVLTNYPYPQYRDRSLAAGADYFFDKSTEFLSVVQVLKELAGHREQGATL